MMWHDFSERQQKVRSLGFGPAIDLLRALCDDAYNALQGLRGEAAAYEHVLVGLSSHAINTLHAVADLLELGHSTHAMALHRTLFELWMQARWLRQDPGPRTEMYIRYENLARYQALVQYEKTFDGKDHSALKQQLAEGIARTAEHFKIITSENERAECLANPASFAERLRKVYRGPGKAGTWYGKPFTQLVDDVKTDFPTDHPSKSGAEVLDDIYRTVYGQASTQIHPTPRAVGTRMQGVKGTSQVNIDVGPDPAWTFPVASSSYSFVYGTLEVLNEAMPFDLDNKIATSLALHDELKKHGWGRVGDALKDP